MHEPCERCESRRWIWCHHSGDGHGGLNGGVWEYLACGVCNLGLRYPKRSDLGWYQDRANGIPERMVRTRFVMEEYIDGKWVPWKEPTYWRDRKKAKVDNR